MTTAYRAYELLSGKIFYPNQGYDGYGDGKSANLSDLISDEMRADWLANREALLEVWGSDKTLYFFPWKPWLDVYRPEALPWAERQFGVAKGRRRSPSPCD